MSSKKKTRRGETKHEDEKVIKKKIYRKFPCLRRPKHDECNGVWTIFHNTSREYGYEWKVKWAACRLVEAIEFMKTEHGHTYNPDSPNENGTKPMRKYSRKKHPHLYRFVYAGDPRETQKHKPAKVASGTHHTQARAADHHQNQHHRAQPPRASGAHAAMLLHMLQQDSGGQRVNDPRVEAWLAGHEAPRMAMPSEQSRFSHEGMVPNPGVAFDQDMAPPRGMAGAQNMGGAPVMPSPQDTPGKQQPQRRHHSSRHGHNPDHSGHGHKHQRHRSRQEANHEQGPQPSAPMAPMPAPVPVPAPAPPPVMYPPEAPSDRQRHRRRRHNSSREPEHELRQDTQPHPTMAPGPPMMPPGMDSPRGVPVPPAVPSAQVAHSGQHQHHRRRPSVHSSHHQNPPSPADMTPPRTMRECMAVMAEEAMSAPPAPPEDPQAGGMVIAPSMYDMPLRMDQTMSAPPTQNMPMRQGPQQVPGMSLAPPASGTFLPVPRMPVASTQNIALCPAGQAVLEMSGPPRMQLPMGPPQAEGIFTTPGTTNAPPPTKATMTTRSTTQNIGPRPGQQPGPVMSPAPPTAGMYGPREMQFSPVGTHQAGGITTAAGASGRLPQNPPLRQPRPQPTNPGMLLRSAGAAGTPGSQAMALRPPPGALSTMPETPPNPSMQPPPASMPPFPGTGPGKPASMDLAVAPPPPAPTPPLYPGALG